VTLNDPVPYLLELLAFPPFYPRHERSMAEFREFSDHSAMKWVAAQLEKGSQKLNQMTFAEVLAAIPQLLQSPDIDATNKEKLQKAVQTKCLKYTFRNEYTRPPKVVTNGPYTLDRWDFKRSLYLKRSENYWDKANVTLASIEMVVNDNVLSQFLQYEAGAVDWLSDVPVDMARDLKAKGRNDLRATKAFGTSFMTLMVSPELPKSILGGAKNPLADIRVRQALALSMDKAAICRDVTGMGEEVASTFVPPGTLKGYDPKPALGYDVAKAKQLLAEAGYPGGQGFPRLPMLYNAGNPTRERMIQVVAKQWESALGIQFDLQQLEVKEYRNRITEKNYAIATAAWYGDYPDVTTFTDKYLSTSLQNDCDWKNAKFDDLCAQAAKEPDPGKRLAILNDAEYLLNTEVPIIPIYYYVNCSIRPDNIRNLGENARNVTVFKGISIEKAVH
jgi:oligopeptide transport system substrate-binding protein